VAILDQVTWPADIRKLSREELKELVRELRERHIDVISQVGGHFGASLGVVELTVALHYVFQTPKDRLVWDTGHQAYIHKILTGRNDRFPTIRQHGGLAPFLSRTESEYDTFGAGHAATSISAALGMATGRDLLGRDEKVVAIIGDGAMGCGLAYEALNNAGHTDRDLIVVLNDNDMSINANVGAMNKYLTTMITNPTYNRVRSEVKSLLQKAPRSVGGVLEAMAGKVEDSVKHLLVPGMIFQELGFRYVGPRGRTRPRRSGGLAGGVRDFKGPVLVHVLTQKGKGFQPAEENPSSGMRPPRSTRSPGSGRRSRGPAPVPEGVRGRRHGAGSPGSPDRGDHRRACPAGPARRSSPSRSRTGTSTWGSPRGTRSRSQPGSPPRGSARSSRSTRPFSSGPTTRSCTTSHCRNCPSSSAWTGRGRGGGWAHPPWGLRHRLHAHGARE
jgi:1-deoxy-D-xylulose-5-phosphate synthase